IQRFTVGRRFCNVICGENSICAGAILDNELLAGELREFRGEWTTDNIGGTAWRETDHDFDGLVRIIRLRADRRDPDQHDYDGRAVPELSRRSHRGPLVELRAGR